MLFISNFYSELSALDFRKFLDQFLALFMNDFALGPAWTDVFYHFFLVSGYTFNGRKFVPHSLLNRFSALADWLFRVTARNFID